VVSGGIQPRRIAGWEFFNNNPDTCSVVRPGGLEALGEGDRRVAESFIQALKGCRRVLDVGCGSGFPGLYVAPSVGELVGVDAAPNMVSQARKNCELLGVQNASFQVGGAEGLRFSDGEFDGAMLCGLLESMDWGEVERMMRDVYRVVSAGGRVAALDQDWDDVLGRKGPEEASVHLEKEGIVLRFVRRSASPHLERDLRYLIRRDSPIGRKVVEELKEGKEAPATIRADELSPDSVLDAWYTESAQFDRETFRNLFMSTGFRSVGLDVMSVWGQRALFLLALR